MIDPHNPPHIDTATDAELQEFLLFSIAVAGKHAGRTAASLASWLADEHAGWHGLAGQGWFPKKVEDFTPFDKLSYYKHKYVMYTDSGVPLNHLAQDMLAGDLNRHGLGCYNQRAKSFLQVQVAFHNWNIREAFFDQLICIYGVGLKTASFFLAYTGLDIHRVILDTHVLKWLDSNGWPEIPKVTPHKEEEYERIAGYFREEADGLALTTLELDKEVWQSMAT